jgi:hypothetical protein
MPTALYSLQHIYKEISTRSLKEVPGIEVGTFLGKGGDLIGHEMFILTVPFLTLLI